MFEPINTERGADSPDGYEEETNSQDGIKSELEALKQSNAELNNKLQAFLASQEKPKTEAPAKLAPEDFKKLMDADPEKAISYALSSGIEMKTREIESKLTRQQQAQYFDTKAEQDFPLLNKDKKFMEVVKNEVRQLVDDGMDKHSPKLVYKAAEIAALKFKGSDETKARSHAESTSEAPSNVRVSKSDGKNLPKQFDQMAKMFGLSDKAKEKAKQNFELRAQAETRRRERNY